MAMVGYDPEVVNQAIRNVKSAYESLINVLGDRMQNEFVGGMEDKWAAPQAQRFFQDSFKPAIDSIIQSSTSTFESVVSSMNSAGQAWASQTESSYSPQTFSPITKTIDVGGIRREINLGDKKLIGIDKDLAVTVADKLPSLATDAKQALSDAQSAVQNSGFVGENQQENLVNSLGQIKTKIDEVVNNITNETKTAIVQTVENYGDTGGEVANAFTLQG